jgi:hypothetical protein
MVRLEVAMLTIVACAANGGDTQGIAEQTPASL